MAGRRGRSQAGQSTVEFAVLLPVLVLSVLVLVQGGLVVRDQLLVQHAAREGARAAAVSESVADVQDAAGARRPPRSHPADGDAVGSAAGTTRSGDGAVPVPRRGPGRGSAHGPVHPVGVGDDAGGVGRLRRTSAVAGGQDPVEQGQCSVLVQRIVAVAALGGLHAGRAAVLTVAGADDPDGSRPGAPRPLDRPARRFRRRRRTRRRSRPQRIRGRRGERWRPRRRPNGHRS